MTNTTHIDALRLRLSHERGYLAVAKSEGERELRKVWIAQIETEIAAELIYHGADDLPQIDDDALLAALAE